MLRPYFFFFIFFFNDTATTEIYTLSLHDALPISTAQAGSSRRPSSDGARVTPTALTVGGGWPWACRSATESAACPCNRSEEHTSELQSQSNLVCRLLLEKKKKKTKK